MVNNQTCTFRGSCASGHRCKVPEEAFLPLMLDMPGADLSELLFSNREKPVPLGFDSPTLDVFLRISVCLHPVTRMSPSLFGGDTCTADAAFHKQSPVLCALRSPCEAEDRDSPVPEYQTRCAGVPVVPCSGVPRFQACGFGLESGVVMLLQLCARTL